MNNIDWLQIVPAGQAIGWTMLHSIWQITLIGVVIRLILLAIPSKHSNTRYFLYLSGLVAAVIWSSASFISYLENTNYPTENSVLEVSSKPLSEIDSTPFAPAEESKVAQVSSPAQFTETVLQEATIADHLQTFFAALQPWMPALAFSWYLGVLWFTFLMMRGFWELHLLHRRFTLEPSAYWQEQFEHLRKQMGIRRKVRFLQSERIKEPITFYFIRPVVLAPVELFTGLTAAQIEVLLLHELAHIRRHDFLVNVFQGVVEILFFYHPVVWWLSKQLRIEREHCCDDLVLSIQQQPMIYAEALTQLQLFNHPLKTKLAMSATGRNRAFSTRIYRLFGQYDKRTSLAKGGLIMFLLLLLLGGQAFMLKHNENGLEEGITFLNDGEQVVTFGPSLPEYLKPVMAIATEAINNVSMANETVALSTWEDEEVIEQAVEEPTSEELDALFRDEEYLPAESKTDTPKPLYVVKPSTTFTAEELGNQLHLLYEAIEHGNLEVVRLLLDQGVAVNGENKKSGNKCRCRKPLVRAAHYEQFEIAKLLIERGADVNAVGSQSYTALIEAADHGGFDLVKLLISKKADINATTKDGHTALMQAAENGYYEIVAYLLEKGADARLVSDHEWDALKHAEAEGHTKIVQLLEGHLNSTR